MKTLTEPNSEMEKELMERTLNAHRRLFRDQQRLRVLRHFKILKIFQEARQVDGILDQ